MKHIRFSLVNAIFSIILILSVFPSHLYSRSNKDDKGYGTASNSGLPDNVFLKKWLVLGPIEISDVEPGQIDEALKKAFDANLITSVAVNKNEILKPVDLAGKKYTWKSFSTEKDIIELNILLGDKNNILCYALSEIVLDEPRKVLVGLGSDDGVKVWVNGTEVHSNYTARAVAVDNDVFEISLNKGSNQILIMILNQGFGYGFSFRALGKDIISDLVIEKAGAGVFDDVKMMLGYSPDLKKTNNSGLTAWQLATIKGRTVIAEYLEENGADKSTTFPSLEQYIENTMSPFNSEDEVPGMALLISKRGNIVYQKGFGNADLAKQLPASTDVKFRIGSITKQFTAAAILKLQEQGKINVSDKVSKYIPDFPRGNEITIHHLLTHTSGLHSYTDQTDFRDIALKPISDSALMELIKKDSFDFNPGERFNYCNSGYTTLGHIVAKVSGKSYDDYLSDEFFIPLGMRNSGVYSNSNRPENEAIGYTFENGKMVNAPDWDMSWAAGAGAIYSTVEDLYTWNEAVFNGKVLSDISLQQAFTPVILNDPNTPPELSYGYGWIISDVRGIKTISHGGGLDGFVSYLGRVPDDQLTITAVANSTPAFAGYYPEMICIDILEYMMWQKMKSQTSYSADTSLTTDQLKAFTGKYDYGRGMILTINLEDKKLMAQMTGQPAFEIYYNGNNEFYWKIVEARIKFITNEQGIVTGAIHFQGGRELEVKKLP